MYVQDNLAADHLQLYQSWMTLYIWLMCRNTELRLACSPDKDTHMVVREPAQCIYIVTVYIPELCQAAHPAILNSPIAAVHDEL